MPSTILVAIWNCTMADGWQARPMNERIAALQDAVNRANTKAGTIAEIDRAAPVRCIFVAPEYAFSDPNAQGIAKPAEQTSVDQVTTLINTSKTLTTTHAGMLLIPGTVAYKEKVARTYYRAWNGAFAAYDGGLLTRFEKRAGVGEVSTKETMAATRLQFMGGVGYGAFTLNGISYGLEICRDATHGGTLPHMVDIHVVMGQGSGSGSIHDHGTEYLIVADPGECRVVMRKRRQPQAAGSQGCLHGATTHYFTLVL